MSEPGEPQPSTSALRLLLEREYSRYLPSTDVQKANANKVFTGVLGPFGIGKTVGVNAAIAIEPRLHTIDTVTTRNWKPEDPAGFITGVSFEDFYRYTKEGKFVNYSLIPDGDAYGTFPEGFTAEYNIGPLLPGSVDQIINAGFRDYHFLYLLSPGSVWRSFVENSRRGLEPATFRKRLVESIDSIEYAEDNISLFQFAESLDEPNGEGIRKVGQKIVDVTFRNTHPVVLPETAQARLAGMKSEAHAMLKV